MRDLLVDPQDKELNRNFCEQVVAYLKPALTEEGPAIQLSDADSPIVTDSKNGLLVTYLLDQGTHFKYVAVRHLSAAGLTEAELHRRAILNLEAMLETDAFAVYDHGDCFGVVMGGNFEASLILVDSLWERRLGDLAPNGFVAAIPSRGILAFCDTQSAAGLPQLREFVIEAEGQSTPDHAEPLSA